MSHWKQEETKLVMHGQLILSSDSHSPITQPGSLVRNAPFSAHRAVDKLGTRERRAPTIPESSSQQGCRADLQLLWAVLPQVGTQAQSFSMNDKAGPGLG